MMPTSEHSFSTISSTCDVRNTVAPCLTHRRKTSRSTRDETASTPSNGSSRKRRSGPGSSAAANASFFFIPCEYSSASFFSSFSSPIIASSSSQRVRTVAAGSRYIRPTNVRYSRPVRLSKRARFSGTTPIRRRTSRARLSSARSSPRTRICPLLGASRPVSILIVVDLPAPLGPRNPKNFPASIRKSNPSTARTLPNARVSPVVSMTRFMLLLTQKPMRHYAGGWRKSVTKRPRRFHGRRVSAAVLCRQASDHMHSGRRSKAVHRGLLQRLLELLASVKYEKEAELTETGNRWLPGKACGTGLDCQAVLRHRELFRALLSGRPKGHVLWFGAGAGSSPASLNRCLVLGWCIPVPGLTSRLAKPVRRVTEQNEL